MDLFGKKLLILAGASVHNKLVNAAKEMGIYTIVTDYLPSSPAKDLADEQWMLDINDVEGIVKQCRKDRIDGVIAGWIDPAQRPYQQICEKLNLPCYGTREQFYKMTDKHAFKKMCIENNLNVIPEYTLEDIEHEKVEYPIFVKPVDSRGSRGQSICYNKEDAQYAIQIAKQESSNGDALIEKYIADKTSFQVTYFYINGMPHLLRTADGYKGLVEEKLDKVALCSISPSIYTKVYMETTHEKVLRMFENLGLHNGPAMLQGFYDDGVFRFYDPGLRFPGVDFECIYKEEFETDLMQSMIAYALTGEMSEKCIDLENVYLSGKKAAVLFPTVSAGKINKIEGLSNIKSWPQVYSVSTRYEKGDQVEWSYDVKQRFAEIDLIANNLEELKKLILRVQDCIKVYDVKGNNMMYRPFDIDRLKENIKGEF